MALTPGSGHNGLKMSTLLLKVRQLLIPTLALALSFLGAWERLWHPMPWVLLTAAWVVLLTQPPMTGGQLLQSGPDRSSALFILTAGNLCMLIPLLDYAQRPEWKPAPASAWTTLGAGLVLAGVAFRVYAIRVLGKHFSSLVETRSEQVLIQHGPYALLRHPSYTGVVLALVGLSLGFQSPWGAAALAGLMVPAYLYRMRVEEDALLSRFGDIYRTYQSKTKRLIPYVY